MSCVQKNMCMKGVIMTIKREIGIGYLIFTLNVLVMIYVVAHNFVKPECLDAFKALSLDRKSTRLNSSHIHNTRLPSSA